LKKERDSESVEKRDQFDNYRKRFPNKQIEYQQFKPKRRNETYPQERNPKRKRNESRDPNFKKIKDFAITTIRVIRNIILDLEKNLINNLLLKIRE